MISFLNKKRLTLLSAFMLYFITGTIHTWPAVSSYLYSYLNHYKPDSFTISYLEVIFSLVNVINSIFIPIGVFLSQKTNPILIIGTGLILINLAKAMFIYFPFITPITFALCVCSIGCGLAYMPPLVCLWKYYPTRKGSMTSIALSGFGLNRLMFKYVSVRMINPQGEAPLPERDRYSSEINHNFKVYLEKSLVFFGVLSVLSILMLYPYEPKCKDQKSNSLNDNKLTRHKRCVLSMSHNNAKKYSDDFNYCKYTYNTNSTVINAANNDNKHSNMYYDYNSDDYISFTNSAHTMSMLNSKAAVSIGALIVSYPFIQLTFIFFFAMVFGAIELASMKKFGLLNGYDEKFLSISSFVWKLTNASCFCVWGCLLDKYGFKSVYMFLMLTQIGICSSCYFTSKYKIGFVLYNIVSAVVNSGNLSISPTSFALAFGSENGAMLHSLSSILFNTFYMCRPLISNLVTLKVHFLIFYLIITLFSMLALIILCFFDPNPNERKTSRRTVSNVRTVFPFQSRKKTFLE